MNKTKFEVEFSDKQLKEIDDRADAIGMEREEWVNYMVIKIIETALVNDHYEESMFSYDDDKETDMPDL